MIITINGALKALGAASWLDNKKWKYSLDINANDPFSDKFNFDIPNNNHALLFKLCWI